MTDNVNTPDTCIMTPQERKAASDAFRRGWYTADSVLLDLLRARKNAKGDQ